MYVNIKILAAFPWFQSLNILVTLTLSHCQKRILARREWQMFYIVKASKIPKPSVLPSVPCSALSFAASKPIKMFVT